MMILKIIIKIFKPLKPMVMQYGRQILHHAQNSMYSAGSPGMSDLKDVIKVLKETVLTAELTSRQVL